MLPRNNFLPLLFVCAVAVSGCTRAQEKQTTKITQANSKHSKNPNALAKESSPYLLMHAHNPVDWHAWNQATLAKAKKLGKPIFLSIGYSSCHWCHVMERESFLDQEIADFLNSHFVCIKVDREERPDIDEIYMQALLIVKQGGGGWPLSMFLTPAGKPFLGGTYWPARDGDRNAPMGFLTIIRQIQKDFHDRPADVRKLADRVTELTRKALAGRAPLTEAQLQDSWVTDTAGDLHDRFDNDFGGFGFNPNRPQMPKFPEPSNLFFLADLQSNQPKVQYAKTMLITTCQRMQQGGIYDHLGGGFHRYSIDRFWHIPHFEKMLYDNGQLASVYAQAYALTKKNSFRKTIEGTLAFVSRELTSPNGAFYSSLDAESEGVEGKFYRWTKDELKKVLNETDFELFASVYRINEAPNFDNQFYVPQLAIPMASHAKAMSISETQIQQRLASIRKKLFEYRGQRTRPLLDKKILTAWNGLMIRGFADAGRILGNLDYIQTATKAAEDVLAQAVNADGRVLRTYTDNQPAKLNGYLIDYACLIDGLIAIHRATGEPRWLDQAKRIQDKQIELFWDTQNGGFFNTSSDHEVLIARSKMMSDRAMPSGNSVAAGNLLYLGKKLNDNTYIVKSKQTVLSASAILNERGYFIPRMLIPSAALD